MSKNKIILFRADSSSTIGTGHIMRDLVLAQKYAKKGAKVIFAVRELDGNINHKIDEAGFQRVRVKGNSKKELVTLIKKLSIDLLVIDHYGINAKKEKYIKKKTGVKILSFDDTYEKHHCDILLNHNIYADAQKYKSLVPSECELRCGQKYTLLRDEFLKVKKEKTVLIAMGGADTAELNIKILKILNFFQYIKVNVVTTTANKNLSKLQKYIKNKHWITLHINTSHLAKLIKESDFAIVTPSVILNEVYAMQLPFIAVQTAENQADMATYLFERNEMVIEDFNLNKLRFFIELQLKNIQYKNFIFLSPLEQRIVHTFRNDKRIRKWMYTQEKITYKSHLSYLRSLAQRDDRVYFLVQKGCDYIGVVDFTNIKKKEEAELGIYANPDMKGQGDTLMQTILSYGFKVLELQKIKANVFCNNSAAIYLYKRFGFVIVAQKKDLLYMELKR